MRCAARCAGSPGVGAAHHRREHILGLRQLARVEQGAPERGRARAVPAIARLHRGQRLAPPLDAEQRVAALALVALPAQPPVDRLVEPADGLAVVAERAGLDIDGRAGPHLAHVDRAAVQAPGAARVEPGQHHVAHHGRRERDDLRAALLAPVEEAEIDAAVEVVVELVPRLVLGQERLQQRHVGRGAEDRHRLQQAAHALGAPAALQLASQIELQHVVQRPDVGSQP